jgi:hypothetical protein
MPKYHIVTRFIKQRSQSQGMTYRCQDTGCQDFDAAETSRNKVANGLNIEAYLIAEHALDRLSYKDALPSSVPNNFEVYKRS